MLALWAVVLVACVALGPENAVAAGPPPPALGTRPVAYVIPIHGVIDLGLAPFVERVLDEAGPERRASPFPRERRRRPRWEPGLATLRAAERPGRWWHPLRAMAEHRRASEAIGRCAGASSS